MSETGFVNSIVVLLTVNEEFCGFMNGLFVFGITNLLASILKLKNVKCQ